ncbi:MAG: carbohydrate kinase [Pseudomonadales bacterium]|nr:carbohydrate kinase [Pseudomonadales bacterium]NRA18487.1 carbohydrate kinase [Oceanospirillaceae bacterium]
MLKLIAFGEALIDMLSNKINNDTQGSETFTKYPGGAPANVAAATAMLGGNSYFAGKIGADMFGTFMRQSLKAAKVNDQYLIDTKLAKTALAFVSLDDQGERSFSFYRDPSADMLFSADDFSDSWFDDAGIFHFCSNTLTGDDITAATIAGIEKAQQAGFCISFDVNLRENLWPEDRQALPLIWQCIRFSDILKVSTEEMQYICDGHEEQQILKQIFAHKVQLLLITDGANSLRYIVRGKSGGLVSSSSVTQLNLVPSNSDVLTSVTRGSLSAADSQHAQGSQSTEDSLSTAQAWTEGSIAPPKIKMLDSTAAGDAFIGGFLYQLCAQQITREKLAHFCQQQPALEYALTFASHCGAHAASIQGAFTSLPSLEDIKI